MKTKIADATLHIDESLKPWQQDVLDDHMRKQRGVIAAGHNKDIPHFMMIEYNPDRVDTVKFVRMIERHGYHAERVG